MDHSDQHFELNRMEATPTTENRPKRARNRPQRARKRAPKTPETRARPKRARETTRKLKTTSLQSLVVKKSGKREKRDPDIYTSESYFRKPTGRDRGVEVVICIRGGSLGARGPNKL